MALSQRELDSFIQRLSDAEIEALRKGGLKQDGLPRSWLREEKFEGEINTGEAKTIYNAIRPSKEDSDDKRSVNTEYSGAEVPPDGEWHEEWEGEETEEKKSFDGQFKYAYRPDEQEGPDVPDDVPITTEEDVRERHNIGPEWVATRKKTKDWTVSMKLKQGGDEVPYTVQNYSINITFERSERRESLVTLADALKDEVEGLPLPEVKSYAYDTSGAAYCALLDLADPHIGKYAWAQQTGRHYDLQRAESIYRLAVDRMCEKLAGSGRGLHHIYVPVGHDGAHVDGGQHTTRGTLQDQDGKWQEISRVARRCYRYALETAVEIAPAVAVVVPGNHDQRDAWYAGEILRARYEGHPHITVQNEPKLERTDRFGENGFLWFHGKDMKLKDLPTFFANEYHELWGQCQWREIFTGHKHKRTKHTVGDFFESDGAITRIAPSLSAPDAWHYRKGYTNVIRGSQCLTYHREAGYDGDIPFNVLSEEKLEGALDE